MQQYIYVGYILYSGIPWYMLKLVTLKLFFLFFCICVCGSSFCFYKWKYRGSPEYIHSRPLFGCLHREHKNEKDVSFQFTAGMLPSVHWKDTSYYSFLCSRCSQPKIQPTIYSSIDRDFYQDEWFIPMNEWMNHSIKSDWLWNETDEKETW